MILLFLVVIVFNFYLICSIYIEIIKFIFYFLEDPKKKIKLTTIPMSKNWKFGREDVDELLFMLQVIKCSHFCSLKITLKIYAFLNLNRMHQILFADLQESVLCLLLVLVVNQL